MDYIDQIFLLLLTIVPTFGILLLFVFLDKFPEPKKIILGTFVLGILTIGALLIIRETEFILFGKIEYSPFVNAFYAASFWEEVLKFCVLYFFCVRFSDFNEPMDGIVYGTVASLGFAFYENITYVYPIENFQDSLWISYMRSFTAVPSHALDGVIMGFFIGRHYFHKNKSKINIYLALIVPITFHGLYDWTLMEEKINVNFMWVVLFAQIFFAIYLFKKLKKDQILKTKEHEPKTI